MILNNNNPIFTVFNSEDSESHPSKHGSSPSTLHILNGRRFYPTLPTSARFSTSSKEHTIGLSTDAGQQASAILGLDADLPETIALDQTCLQRRMMPWRGRRKMRLR
jgi:hypothetical protein